MHHQHRLDIGVPGQPVLHPGQINIRLGAKIQHLDLQPQRRGHHPPGYPETAGGQNQQLVTARTGIGQGRLPCCMAVADVNRGVMGGAGHRFQVGIQAVRQVMQLPGIDVGCGPMHRGQHPVWHDRRAGDGKVMTTVRQHESDL